jgi:anti-anti-sigma factor
MEVSESLSSDVPVIEVRGDVDHATCDALWIVADRALGGGSHIALDLSGCPYMDSGGISVLLTLLRRVRPEGIVAVIAPDPDVMRIFEMVGITVDRNFRLLSSPDELALFAG